MAKFWVGLLRRFPEPNGPWGVDYKDLVAKRKRKTWGQKKKDGEQGRRKLIRELEDGTHTASSTKTFGDALDLLLEDYERRHKVGDRMAAVTLYTRRNRIKNHIRPALGKIRLTEITTEEVRPFINGLSLSHKTLHGDCHIIVNAALDLAVDRGLITINRLRQKKLRLPPTPKPETYCPNLSEGKALWHSLQERQYRERSYAHVNRVAAIALAMFAGLRRGEVAGLQWPSVDWVGGNILVDHSWCPRLFGLKVPKSGKPRKVPMSSEVREALTCVAERDGWPQEGFVLRTERGASVYSSIMSNYFPLAMRQAGHVNENGKPKWRYHDLRHYAGSVWLMSGATVYTVSKRLGHASTAITEEVYLHLLEEMDNTREVMDKVSELHRLLPPIRDFDDEDAEDVEIA